MKTKILDDEPVEYEKAREYAERNQQKAIQAIPVRLIDREDRFYDQLRRSKIGPMKKLEMLYAFMDELSSAISSVTPCKRQCSACCHYNVSVSEIEVSFIERKTKHRRTKDLWPKMDFHGQPCPFLDAGACAIYPVRPFVCRRHHALAPNNYWCNPQRSNQEFALIRFSNVDGVFELIRLEANQGLPKDIRQYFFATD